MQVIAILLLLGSDNQDWIPTEILHNHVVEIPTGEGKSIVLGVTAIILSYFGFYVDCVCYSKYLSSRDYEEFEPLFSSF